MGTSFSIRISFYTPYSLLLFISRLPLSMELVQTNVLLWLRSIGAVGLLPTPLTAFPSRLLLCHSLCVLYPHE